MRKLQRRSRGFLFREARICAEVAGAFVGCYFKARVLHTGIARRTTKRDCSVCSPRYGKREGGINNGKIGGAKRAADAGNGEVGVVGSERERCVDLR